MPRRPSIWWRETHGAWFTTVKGKQVNLGADRRAAEEEFARLTLARSGSTPRIRVAELTQLWLTDLKSRSRELTWVSARQFARVWVKRLGTMQARELKPYHVTAWLDGHKSWGVSTRSIAVRAMKNCFRWGVGQGYLDRHPLESLRAPRAPRREALSETDLAAWLSCVTFPAVRDFVAVALETGARPGELRSITAKSLSGSSRVAIVEGKTGKRTISLSDRSWAILGRLAKQWPDGPLLRSPLGRPWTIPTLSDHFGRVSRASGVHVVPYHLRGVFATRSLRVNGEILTAKLLGHKDLSMLLSNYEGLDSEDLRAAVNRVTKKRR